MKMLEKLERSLATRYVCQTCEKEKERRTLAYNATKCLERNSLLAESNQAASIEIHRLEKALAKAELERDVAREMLIERSTSDTRPGGGGIKKACLARRGAVEGPTSGEQPHGGKRTYQETKTPCGAL